MLLLVLAITTMKVLEVNFRSLDKYSPCSSVYHLTCRCRHTLVLGILLLTISISNSSLPLLLWVEFMMKLQQVCHVLEESMSPPPPSLVTVWLSVGSLDELQRLYTADDSTTMIPVRAVCYFALLISSYVNYSDFSQC